MKLHLAWAALALPAVSAQETAQATVRVDARALGARISDHVYGNNLIHYSGEILWDRANSRPDAVALGHLKELKPTVLRFPGGGKAEEYDWRACVGPKRGGEAARFYFGTDEFMRLCRELGAEPMITVNWSAGPSEAAAWVEYCNGDATTPQGRQRAANGHPEPYRVGYWELGNETYNKAMVKAYAETVPGFAHAMKAADPSIQLGGVGWGWPNWRSHYTKDPDPWNETLMARAGAHLDALVIHPYCWLDPKPPPEKVNADLVRSVLAWPRQMAGELAAVRESLAAAGRPALPLWATEHNGYYGEKGMCPPLVQTFNGVLNAAMVHEFLRLGLPVANYWHLASPGWDHFAVVAQPRPDLWLLRPSRFVLALYSQHCRGHLLPTAVDAPTYDYEKQRVVIRAGRAAPALDALAVRSRDRLTAMLINKQPDAPLSVTLQFAGAPIVREAVTHTFAGSSPFATDFRIQTASQPTTLPVRLALPPCSVTALVLTTEVRQD
ncbi:MAG: hypothetical protein FJ272_16460 [Planctomycetes bacterium]|nr:hypothetical protein [Planctomycetota bacterium]